MNIDRIVLAFAGSVVLLSVILAHFVSSWWLLLTLFIAWCEIRERELHLPFEISSLVSVM